MKNKEQQLFKDNYIEQMLKAAYGYEDEQLLAEFERARTQPDDPGLIPPTNEFQQILTRIKAEKLQGEKQITEGKVIRIRKMRKTLVLVAVLGVLVMSMGIVASGNRQLNYWNRTVGGSKTNRVWNNYNNMVTVATEKEAYEAIQENLGIQALELGYTPKGIKFVEAEIGLGQARLEFIYEEQRIQFYEAIYDVENSTGTFSDRKSVKTVYNKWLEQEISIEKNTLEDGRIEYGVRIESEDAQYSLTGIMDEEVFLQIIENLKLYK